MATRGIVLNRCYGGLGLSEEGKNLLIQKGMSKKDVMKIDYSSHLLDYSSHLLTRMNPLLVACVRKYSKFMSGVCSQLKVVEVPVPAIEAGAISIKEYDGLEEVKINWDKVALWKKSNEQPKLFALLEAAINDNSPNAEVMHLLEQFKKTIPAQMLSKPVPGVHPFDVCRDEE